MSEAEYAQPGQAPDVPARRTRMVRPMPMPPALVEALADDLAAMLLAELAKDGNTACPSTPKPLPWGPTTQGPLAGAERQAGNGEDGADPRDE